MCSAFLVATLYFNFMAILVNEIPLGAFRSRESEMEWIKSGSHLKPIILSPVVREQCKIFLTDAFTRNLFNLATDPEVINAEIILQRRDKRDDKLEKELNDIRTQSVTRIAAKEAMEERTSGWRKSKWAKDLSRKVVSNISHCILSKYSA